MLAYGIPGEKVVNFLKAPDLFQYILSCILNLVLIINVISHFLWCVDLMSLLSRAFCVLTVLKFRSFVF